MYPNVEVERRYLLQCREVYLLKMILVKYFLQWQNRDKLY